MKKMFFKEKRRRRKDVRFCQRKEMEKNKRDIVILA
jgi:hypothetical protein